MELYCGKPNDEDFKILKDNFVSDDITRDDIFVFRAKACDNIIDRSSDRFSRKALEFIKDHMVGKPFLEDHDSVLCKQRGSIFKSELKVDNSRKNELGEDYTYVEAYIYVLDNEDNKNFIKNIKAGIFKGVSVSFGLSEGKCNICGAEYHECNHIKGNVYGGNKCVRDIMGVDEFYELSSVAIPCQPEAGVTKQYKEDNTMTVDKAVLELSSKGVSNDVISFIKETIGTSKSVLGEELEKRDKQISDLRGVIKGMRISNVINKLHPVSDEARELVEDILEGLMDGEGELPENIEDTLATKYGFLFSKEEDMGSDGDSGTEGDDGGTEGDNGDIEGKEGTDGDIEGTDGDGKGDDEYKSKKSIGFTRATKKSTSIISARTLAGIRNSGFNR